MDLIKIFNNVRDIPYRIPLNYEEEDNCCSGKSEKLLKMFSENGIKARYRVCIFLWQDLNLPADLIKIPHDLDCTHSFVEVFLNGSWKKIDATWDISLSEIFHINIWDGKSSTKIGVKPIKTFTPKKSMSIMSNQSKEVIENDLSRNREFYKAFNDWLEKIRKQKG
jgi:hypothetical protein